MSWPAAPLLLCSSSSRTGPVEGMISLAAILRARGLDARIAGDTVREGDLQEHLARAQVPLVDGLHLSRKTRLSHLWADAKNLAAWVQQGSPDLLHTHMSNDHWLALQAARRAGPQRANLRLVRSVHRAVDLTPAPLTGRFFLLRRTDGVIVHAESYRQRLIDAGLDARRVRAIPGSVDAERFSPGPSSLRDEWGVPAGAPVAGIVARMKADRGHEALLAAFAQVLAKLPEAHLVLIGRGEHEPRLRELALSLPAGHVHFGGYRRGDELRDAYRALDVAVWLREGNDGACRGVLEAMACGVPVVAGDQGAPAELVASHSGRTVDANSPGAIAAALLTLLADLPLARSLGQSARIRAQTFTPERAADSTLAFWRELRALPPIERQGLDRAP